MWDDRSKGRPSGPCTSPISKFLQTNASASCLEADRRSTDHKDVPCHPIGFSTYSRAQRRRDRAQAGLRRSVGQVRVLVRGLILVDRKSTRLNSSHLGISYALFFF